MRLIVRSAESRDASSIFGLTQAFATSFVVETTAFEENFPLLLSSPEVDLAVADEAGLVVGYILAYEHRTLYANGSVAWIEELMVHADHRRSGIGSLLMSRAEEWAQSRGCRLIALATRRAAPFYRAVGYEESALYFRKQL